MKIDVLINEYLREKSAGLSESSVKVIKERLGYFLKFFKERNFEFLTQIHAESIASFVKNIENSLELQSNTKYVYLQSLQHFLRFLYEKNFLMKDYSEKIELPKWERKIKPIYSDQEIMKIIEKEDSKNPVDMRNRLILALHFYEKLKTAQIEALNMLDVDLQEKTLRVVSKKEFILLKPEMIKHIKDYFQSRALLKPRTDFIFTTISGGKKMLNQSIRKVIKEALKNGE